MVDLSNIEKIDDEVELNKMLGEASEFDERKTIRKRLLEVKELKSKQRAKEMQERENRMQKEIEDRTHRKEEEKKEEIRRLEDLAKTSTADRIENEAGKKRQEYIKEKYQTAEDEKKKNLKNFEKLAKNKEHENENKINAKTSVSGSKIQNTSMNSAQSKNSSASSFALFQNKDKEAGSTGKGSMVQVASANPNSPQAIKDNLLKWCQQRTEGYPNVNIQNFSSCWADGMAFCALIHSAAPETFDFNKLNAKNRRGNFNLAFKVAEDKCDISPLLDVEDMLMMGNKPDWKCVFTYVQSIYRKLELEPRARAAKNDEN